MANDPVIEWAMQLLENEKQVILGMLVDSTGEDEIAAYANTIYSICDTTNQPFLDAIPESHRAIVEKYIPYFEVLKEMDALEDGSEEQRKLIYRLVKYAPPKLRAFMDEKLMAVLGLDERMVDDEGNMMVPLSSMAQKFGISEEKVLEIVGEDDIHLATKDKLHKIQ